MELKLLNDSIERYIGNRNISKAKILIDILSSKELRSSEDRFLLHKNRFYYYFLKQEFDSCAIEVKKINTYSSQLSKETLSDHYINIAFLKKSINQLDSSAFYYVKSLNFYGKDSTLFHDRKTTIYQGLYSLYRQIGNRNKEYNYLVKYLKAARKGKLNNEIAYGLNNLAVYYDNDSRPKQALEHFKEALIYMKPKRARNSIYQNIGSIYLNHFDNIDSSVYYNKKAMNQYTSKRTLAYIHRDLSIIAKRKNNLIEEGEQLLKAVSSLSQDNFPELQVTLYKKLSENYKKRKQFKKSLEYLERFDSLNNVLKNQALIEKVEDIETKYQTEKKNNENLQLKQRNLQITNKQQQDRNLLVGALSFIVLGSFIAFLMLKNSKKKQQLAEQEKALETQRNLTLLKEQEINTINAMVEGQEKERKRVAEDLHDNLGSVLATLKLHFENLRINKKKQKVDQQTLFDKTENLIDEAYLKVRSIAHAKNAGVIANQGLLRAVQIMADKISSANTISIEVVQYGLDTPLENSLEIAVFRIIQELTTNVLKHAQATNATINLSRHDNVLNVIVEDNGNGFEVNTADFKAGMGLHSIKTRIEHLKGELIIDSTKDKGTTIIINIPFE